MDEDLSIRIKMGIKGENRGAGEGDLRMRMGPLEEGYNLGMERLEGRW